MKQTTADTGDEAEPEAPAFVGTFHRPGETKPYDKFNRDLQYWRGTKLREYYEALENPVYRRRSTEPGNVPDLLDRLRKALNRG